MQQQVDDFIAMNTRGLVLELCEKYYDDNVVMLNNGTVFANSMQESYDKQKGFVSSIKEFDVRLISSQIIDNIVELVFSYKMTGADLKTNAFTGKHIQTWLDGKIVREEYLSIE
mgnify:FL=1